MVECLLTDGQMDGRPDAMKHIISSASQLIKIVECQFSLGLASPRMANTTDPGKGFPSNTGLPGLPWIQLELQTKSSQYL